MFDIESILTVIDDALARKGLSDAAASQMAVGNRSYIKNLRASAKSGRATRPSFTSLQSLACVLDLQVTFSRRVDANSGSDLQDPVQTFAQSAIAPGLFAPIAYHPENKEASGVSPIGLGAQEIADIGVPANRLRMASCAASKIFPGANGAAHVLIDVGAPREGYGAWVWRDGDSIEIGNVFWMSSTKFILTAQGAPPRQETIARTKIVLMGQVLRSYSQIGSR